MAKPQDCLLLGERRPVDGWSWDVVGAEALCPALPARARSPDGFGAWQSAVFPWQIWQREKAMPVLNYKDLAPGHFEVSHVCF